MLNETQVVLNSITDGLLDDLCGEDERHCKKVVVYSEGHSAVRQPTRLNNFQLAYQKLITSLTRQHRTSKLIPITTIFI